MFLIWFCFSSSFVRSLKLSFSILLQSIAIGYKRAHPNGVAVVHAFDPKPCIKVKTSDEHSVPFRKFGFVDAVEDLDPTGSLGLLDPDFKVDNFSAMCSSFFVFY